MDREEAIANLLKRGNPSNPTRYLAMLHRMPADWLINKIAALDADETPGRIFSGERITIEERLHPSEFNSDRGRFGASVKPETKKSSGLLQK